MSKKVFLYYILFVVACSFEAVLSAERQELENTINKESIRTDEELDLFLDDKNETETDATSTTQSLSNSQQIDEKNGLSNTRKATPTETDTSSAQGKTNEETADTFSTSRETNQAEIDVFDEDDEEDIFSSLDQANELNTKKQNLNTNSAKNTQPDLTEIYPQNSASSVIEAECVNVVLLDKNTGQRHIYKMYGNDTVSYCNFEITLIKCVKNINPFKQDDLAFFTIHKKDVEEKNIIFSGWISKNNIFTSNISKSVILLSVLECFEK